MNVKSLVLIAGFMVSCFMAGAVTDSLGIKEEDGKKYIMHRIDQGETLYAISKRYEVDVEVIKETNPQTEDELVVGEVILVPLRKTKDAQNADEYKYHTVKEEETLFSISQQYDASVAQIKEWNDLSSNNIEVGQKLKVGKKAPSPEKSPSEEDKGDTSGPNRSGGEKAAIAGENENRATEDDSKGKSKDTGASEDTLANEKEAKDDEESMSKYEEKYVKKEKEVEGDKEGWITKKQEGKATWISDRNMSTRKSLALHRSAPPGTVIRVENPQNEKVVYVKTVGLLNDEHEEKTLITISQKAAEELGIDEDFFRAKLEYSVEEEQN